MYSWKNNQKECVQSNPFYLELSACMDQAEKGQWTEALYRSFCCLKSFLAKFFFKPSACRFYLSPENFFEFSIRRFCMRMVYSLLALTCSLSKKILLSNISYKIFFSSASEKSQPSGRRLTLCTAKYNNSRSHFKNASPQSAFCCTRRNFIQKKRNWKVKLCTISNFLDKHKSQRLGVNI